MIRKYQNHKPQTTPWYREPLNHPLNKLYVRCMYKCNSIPDQSVNKFPFPNKIALNYIHTFVRLHLTIISIVKDNFQITAPKCESQSNQYYCYFSNFLDIPTVFLVIKLKFYHKVIPSKDADRNANSFNPNQAVPL